MGMLCMESSPLINPSNSRKPFQTPQTNTVPTYVTAPMPEIVFIKLLQSQKQYFPDLPPGVVPVLPHKESNCLIQLPNNCNIYVPVEQIPLTPAFALTTEKSQGMTLTHAVVAPLRHKTRTKPQRSALYVAFSRVTDPKNLRIMEPLQMSTTTYSKPTAEIVHEIQHLEQIENKAEGNP